MVLPQLCSLSVMMLCLHVIQSCRSCETLRGTETPRVICTFVCVYASDADCIYYSLSHLRCHLQKLKT